MGILKDGKIMTTHEIDAAFDAHQAAPVTDGVEGLKPCPFCGVQMNRQVMHFFHPDGDCVLDKHGFYNEEAGKWNTRPQPEGVDLPHEPTPAMASAGMRVIASLPDDANWPSLARAACEVWRAMVAQRPAVKVEDD